jgi:UDP-glucose 4-epimerase
VITKFVERVSAGKPPVIDGDGLQTRDFIHARDVARMVCMLAERKDLSGEVLNCGSGTTTSILDLAKLVVSVSGKALEPEFGPPRQGDIRHSCADMKKVRSLTGFEAMTPLSDGLSELLG